MGLLRKVISGSLALGTGGLSLGVVQYRSDTERNTRQVALLRQDEQRRQQELMAVRVQETSTGPEAQSVLLGQIERLHALHLAGALSREEFEAEKRSRMTQISGL